MKKIKLILILGVLSIILSSFISADTELTDCGEINSSDTYYLTEDIITNQALESCFEITADNVTIDCGSWEITNINTEEYTTLFYVDNQENINIQNCFITNFNTGVYVNDVRDSRLVNNSYVGFIKGVDIDSDFNANSGLTISRNSFLELSGTSKPIYANSLNSYTDEDLIIVNNNFYNNFYPITIKKDQSEDFHIFSNFFLDYTSCKNNFIPELGVCDEEREFFIPYGYTPSTSGFWYIVDEFPLQCANGWDGETSVCERAKYESEDLSSIIVDSAGTLGVELKKHIVLIIMVLIFGFIFAHIRYEMKKDE